MEAIVHFKENGVVEQERDRNGNLRRTSLLPELRTKLEDPNFPIHELLRLISLEIVSISQQMSECENDPSLQYKMKGYNDQIKGLRELAKSVTETDLASKKDTLNFDGEKFKYVFSEIIGAMHKAIKDAGCEDSLKTSIMKHFGDIMRMKESDLRRDVLKIESVGGIK